MYGPEPNDNYNEWIELYNPTNKSVNVSDWSITDNSAEDTLEGDFDHGNGTTITPSYGYAIIADHGTSIYENFSISNDTIPLYVDDSSIGNGLGNSKDKLMLKNSTGTVLDAVKCGYNYTDVPGMPADLVDEGHSLARCQNVDTNDSSNDFYEGTIPTPGITNELLPEPSLNIELHPQFIPKILNNSDHSLPFAININISNYAPNESYQLKSYVVGNISSSYPATQTWNGASWKYSNNYISTIFTDEYGNWTDWVYLRFKKDYKDKEYEKYIENNNTAYLKVKIKKEGTSSTDEIYKEIYLLDMDNSTSNGTIGGYAVGVAGGNNAYIEGKIIVVENITGIVTGIYVTENNGIDEELISASGYYKISSPVGSGYTIKFYEKDGSLIRIIQNVTIKQGEYGVDIYSPENYYLVRRHETLNISLTVENTGDFYDTLDIAIEYVTSGWQASLDKGNISLNPKEAYDVYLHIIPCQQNGCKSGNVTISTTSEKDIGKTDEITFELDIPAPDLTIKKIKMYDENNNESNVFGHGEQVKIKAFLSNLGDENATNVDVMFYYDSKDREHFIGSKHYDVVSKYQKYPSVKWDTQDVTPGNHTVFVIADKDNRIDELDESNNELSFEIMILNTYPSMEGRNILITEVYYHTHPNIKNEFVALYNPTNQSVNLSGWYITNQPVRQKGEQTKIIFPENTTISPESWLYVTQNASAYLWEMGGKPDFEYKTDSDDDVPQMDAAKTMTLSNAGGMVALKDWYNHTIDIIVYGESDYNVSGWKGPSIPDSGAGVILKRNFNQSNHPVDTNTSNDWVHPRRYGIGQSDFPYVNIPFHGEIKTFVSPDCSYQTIVDELRKANESIYFNIYEFTNPFLCDELVAALQRDVSVNILVEGSPVGGIDDREKYILNKIASYRGHIRFIVNDKENNVHARYTFDHGKYLVIDNITVIVESCNWAKTGIPIDPSFGNREWGIVVRNEEVAEYFLNVFLDDWNPRRCDSYSFDDMDFTVSPDFYMDETVTSGSYEPEFESEIFNGSFSAIPVFSPDTSYEAICDLIESARTSIYIEQLYIYKDWSDGISPFVERLVNKSKQGVDIKVILNYNPYYKTTNEKCNLTKQYFEEQGIKVKFLYTNWSYFTNVHNKGMIVDNQSVLIASINWNENSVTRNREAGIIIENEDVAEYYTDVFFYDWNLLPLQPPDLTITNIKFYDENNEKNNTFGEGEIVKIKASLKNVGDDNATDFNVTFYYDYKDKEHFIGSKHYESIGKYQKYPMVKWDTKDITPGNHTVFVIADENNQIDEVNESNNELSVDAMIYSTYPTKAGRDLLITEVYYHVHTRVNNEFIGIYNPTDNDLDISGWYITNKPLKSREKQTKIIFPDNTTIPPETRMIITQNASAYVWETGKKPDFEYKTDSDDDVPQMDTAKTMTLSNAGGMVALKDWYNHTIDVIVYGESNYNCSGWNGSPVPSSGAGVILKRNVDHKNQPIDTNTSEDWLHPRRYGIGQSDFPYVNISFYGEITTFVSPDCSFQTIVDELRKANKPIYFNIYEFTNPFLCDELVAALKRGVSVNVFLEGAPVGGIDDREQFILNRIANNGGKIRFIVNDPDNDVYDRYRFDHGKYLVIDNYTVIVESCNWAKTGIPKDPTFGNREWGIVVRNKDVAAYFLDVFLDDWNPLRCDSYSFENMDFSIPPDFYLSETVYSGSYEPQFESKTVVGNFSAIPVFSPDTSQQAILDLINSAETSILIEQLYIYKDWTNTISPFVERLVNKSKNGVDIKVILNYNPRFEPTNIKQNATKKYLEENGIEVKFHYTNWSYFANVHNKGMIVDNTSVLISSINWNENSVTRNREAGLIIENEEIALYYAEVFFYDWKLDQPVKQDSDGSSAEYKNPSLIVAIYGMTFALVARDWRKRKWS